jgi:hypothetical protein
VENSPIVQASNQGIKGFLINLIACLYPDVVKYLLIDECQYDNVTKLGGGKK